MKDELLGRKPTVPKTSQEEDTNEEEVKAAAYVTLNDSASGSSEDGGKQVGEVEIEDEKSFNSQIEIVDAMLA